MENQIQLRTGSTALQILGPRPIEYLQAVNPKSAQDVLLSVSPSLVAIVKSEGGEPIAKALLTKAIQDVIEFFNVGKCMNAPQVMQTAELILESYGQYKIDDWILCFKHAKLGHYGAVYDRIDGQVIFSWFEKYLFGRDAEIEQLRQREKRQLEKAEKEIQNSVPMPDYIKELIGKKKAEKPSTVKIINQTDQQKKINTWMYDFDQLWELQGSEGGKRFVNLDNRKMDISEYLEYRFANET